MADRKWTGVKWLVFWGLIVMAVVLLIDLLYVMWPYPNGARGIGALQSNLNREWALLVELGGNDFPKYAYAIHGLLYHAFFVLPGFDYMMAKAADPTPMSNMDEMMRSFVLSTRIFWESAAIGLQLFSSRLAVLTLAAPLILLILLGAVADGLVTWCRRRTGGGRESGFIYHRAKRMIGGSVLMLCFFYLVPPIPMDPRLAFPPFLLALWLSTRIAMGYFKKYV